MKYLHKLLIVAALSTLAFASQAVVITQDVYLRVLEVDDTNQWGISSDLEGDTVLFGSVSYESDNVSFAGEVSSLNDPFFSFDVALAGFSMSLADEIDPFALPTLALVNDDTNPLSGIAAIDIGEFTKDGADILAIANFFSVSLSPFEEIGGFYGGLSFGRPTAVSEPSLLAMFGLGLLVMLRCRQSTK